MNKTNGISDEIMYFLYDRDINTIFTDLLFICINWMHRQNKLINSKILKKYLKILIEYLTRYLTNNL